MYNFFLLKIKFHQLLVQTHSRPTCQVIWVAKNLFLSVEENHYCMWVLTADFWAMTPRFLYDVYF